MILNMKGLSWDSKNGMKVKVKGRGGKGWDVDAYDGWFGEKRKY